MSDKPLSHVIRPDIPWRLGEDQKTECGKSVGDVKKAIPRDEAVRLWKKHGAQRMAFVMCMTCVDTVNRGHSTWDTNPMEVLSRWWVRSWGENQSSSETRLNCELWAIEKLIEAHREEFEQLLDGVKQFKAPRGKKAAG